MVASTFALICCFLLKSHPGSATQRKVFSTLTGIFIHYYVFGVAGLASLATNVISYATIRLMPRESQHIIIFVVSGLGLSLAQIHKQVYSIG